jgi:hypothetical protein
MSSRVPVSDKELHRTGRIAWLRAAVLGANDGILSTSSLVLGVAAAHATHSNVLVAGVAGLVWWPGQCRWQRESTYLSTHKLTPNRPSLRLSALAMALTAAVGWLFGTVV